MRNSFKRGQLWNKLPEDVKQASPADVFRGSSRVSALLTSAVLSGKNIDQSQHTSRSEESTLDLEKFRA